MAQNSTRSKVEQFRKEFITHARQAGGSFVTVADRERIARHFLDYLKNNGIKLRQMDSLKVKYIERYIAERKAHHINHRTLQNEMSVLRAILAQAGKHKLANPANARLSNQALGIADMSRKGTKTALTPAAFREIFQQVEQKDRSVAAVMQLAYVLGLRTKEAVEAYKSLATWKKGLENGHTSVRVVFGTKGGRPRQTVILDRVALQHAIAYAERERAERGGKLIDKPTITQAINRYRYIVRSAGLSGNKAPHSMRYHFAQQSGAHYKAQGFSGQEVLALVSMDLGHGDGRGRYIRQVYYQNIEGE
ncbi:integrase domain-containing protein [Xenorhabdus bovienii]|uniref:integrase domain-containing protein n=2 Tax=Xenorhabdus bovienii TaxID=40576 RepID=UPI00237C9D6F|nr:integrase domain-containing protein [Xenorhabdus bovienii]MDE1476107.1 integrase domain-containing protein [Xenorhabdus bovienii]MDE1484570.1 integrase domain-containing protein [Xenorhabdus bovienii]MDE9430530.1 integrase domain-containing protein [Xenorhabdus bovienii]MDE9443168.1 integrase domain-containing protein [Xenorhabdus bovienii]MDE9460129.1 integrase domain-containing protein [Xenorhabdus bovienii]